MVRSAVSWSSLDEVLAGVASLTPELVDWRVREIFRDPQPSGSSQAGDYSLLLGTTFQAGDRTLREEELQGVFSTYCRGSFNCRRSFAELTSFPPGRVLYSRWKGHC